MNNLRAIMKETEVGEKPAGLLKKKFGAPKPSQSTKVKPPSLLKRLTGK